MPVSDSEIEERRALGIGCSEGCYDCSVQDRCRWFNASQSEINKAVVEYRLRKKC
jgi:hypothetical protein